MHKFVLDTSVAATWYFEDESSDYADLVLDSFKTSKAIVPHLWSYEICNVLLTALKKGRISENITSRLSLIEDLPIEIDESPTGMRELFLLSSKHSLTAYDGAYLSLCLRLNLPLASNDAALNQALLEAGGRLYLK